MRIRLAITDSNSTKVNGIHFFFHTLLNVKTKKQSVPLFLLIFVLEELFELLGVLHVRAAVRLWLKHTQPGPSADLQTHTHTHT